MIVAGARIIFLVNMTWQYSVMWQKNINILEFVARVGISQLSVEPGSKHFGLATVRHGIRALVINKLRCLFQDAKHSRLQRIGTLMVLYQIGYCRYFDFLVEIVAVLWSLLASPSKMETTIQRGKVLVHFPIPASCIHWSAVRNHVQRKLVLKPEKPSWNLSVQIRQMKTGGIKQHNTVF